MENSKQPQTNSLTAAALCSPEGFTLTAAPGYTITAECQRNSAGEVLINAVCEGDFTESAVIGHIPQGFRPRTELNEVVQMLGASSSQSNVLRVATGGEMRLLHGGLHMSKCYFTLGYISEGEASGCIDTYTKAEIDALLASKANAGSSEILPITVMSGTSVNQSLLWKNQFNEVHFSFRIVTVPGIAHRETIAVLPEGYRPSTLIAYGFPHHKLGTYENTGMATIVVLPSGEIYSEGIPADSFIALNGSFPAAEA